MGKLKIFFSTFSILLIYILPSGLVKAQIVRLAKLEIDSTQLESYKIFLKNEIESSIQLEKGVLTLYAVFEIKKPTHLTILEIYTDKKAYEKHIHTPHFKKYKEGTKGMVKALELIETLPLIPNMKIK